MTGEMRQCQLPPASQALPRFSGTQLFSAGIYAFQAALTHFGQH
jgi:hypothetical protein